MCPQERHVELAAVERHQQRKLGDIGGELFEVDAVDEQGQFAAAQRADERHLIVVGRQAGGLDVQEQRLVGEIRVEPPRLAVRQQTMEEACIAAGHGSRDRRTSGTADS